VKDVAYRPFQSNGGLHWYSPYTGLWAATILLLVLGLVANTGSWKNRTPLIIIALALTASIVISGSRVLFLFIPLSLLVVLIRLITLPNVAVSRRVLAAIFISITVVSAGAVLIPDTYVNKRVKMLLKDQAQMTKDQNSNYETSLGLRYLWWKGGFNIWKRSPWIGHGGGSIMEQFALQETMMPSEFGANVTNYITPDPHSSLLATLIEQGILGASCMISFVLVSLIGAWRKAVSDPAMVGLIAAWSTLVAIGLFHTIHLSAYAIPLVSVLTVLSIRSAPPHSQ
jgi:O-antigen ligase